MWATVVEHAECTLVFVPPYDKWDLHQHEAIRGLLVYVPARGRRVHVIDTQRFMYETTAMSHSVALHRTWQTPPGTIGPSS